MVKKQMINMCLGSMFMLVFSTTVFADTANVLNVSEILKRLQAANYTAIHEVELEKNIYDVKALNSKGQKVKLSIDAKTGDVPAQDTKSSSLSIQQAAEKVETAGYVIHKIESEKNHFEIKAIDAKGKKVKLKVNANTGAIIKERF